MSRPRRSLAVRDQSVSAFSGALMRLCDATAAHGAALVDSEGETVDYAGSLEPYEIRVVAAEWRLVFAVLLEQRSLSSTTMELYYRSTKRSFAVISMEDGYAIVLEMPHRSLRPSHRALAEAIRTISVEAGLSIRPHNRFGRERWTRVDVRWDDVRRRPSAIWLQGDWRQLEILGRFAEPEPASRTVGYRALLADGTELTLVRETLGVWYADDIPHSP
jgi:hypothetical protein